MSSVAVVLFDFESQRSDQLSLSRGQLINILEQSDSGWWKGSDQLGRIGIFPYNYVQVKASTSNQFKIAKALYTFKSDNEEDLSFEEGEMITIIQELSEEWFLGRSEDGQRTGQFPVSYVEITEKQDVKAAEAEAKRFEELEKKAKAEADAAAKEREAAEKRLMEEHNKQRLELEKKKLELEAELAREREALAAKELELAKERALLKKKREEEALRRQSARIEAERAREEIQKMAIRAKTKFAGEDPGPAPEKIEEEVEDDAISEVDDNESVSSRRSLIKRISFKYKSKFANLGGGSKCAKCNKTVGFADKVKAMNTVWHVNCFRCTTCNLILRQGNFSDHKGKPYCKICYGKGFGVKGFGYGGVTVPVDRKEKRVSGSVEIDTSSPMKNLTVK